MHKNTLWFIVGILCIYFSLVLCEATNDAAVSQELETQQASDLLKSDSTDLTEEGRTRRHRHRLHALWGFQALAVAYLVKVKIVIVAFFVGSAVWLGLRYLWPQKCNYESYKEGAIILDHPPSFADHHDHIPYSLDHDHDHYADHHHFDSSSFGGSGLSNFEPYSAYANSYSGSDIPVDTTSPESHTFRKKRDVNGEEDKEEEEDHNKQVEESQEESRQSRPATEEQIGDFMFSFLGLDSTACRRRFICEMEFRSKVNPLTAMAFRVVGRSFFGKYTNDKNEFGRAKSFEQCAAVNSECVFVETEETEEPTVEPTEEVEEIENTNAEVEEVHTDDNLKVDLATEESSLESNNIEEKENINNIKAELRTNSYRRRVRGDRYLNI